MTDSDRHPRVRTPRDGERPPWPGSGGLPDTAGPGPVTPGWYRPRHRRQDPAYDPAEPTGESDSAGYDHGWSNCTMTTGAMALDYQTGGQVQDWGGDLRHSPSQPDMSGGTDLYDLSHAWLDYGHDLEVMSGAGWGQLQRDRVAARAVVLQGTGEVPGSGAYAGGHCTLVLPEPHPSDAGLWLQGDPLCWDFECVREADLRKWAERLASGLHYAVTQPRPYVPPPPPLQEGDVMFNVAPMTTHRLATVRDGAIIYGDSMLSERVSVVTDDTVFAFGGSVGGAHIIIPSGGALAGQGVYVHRADVVLIAAGDRSFT